MHAIRFAAPLFRLGATRGAWTFVEVPSRLAPPARHAWGRTPVVATVEGRTWRTSVWRERSGRTLLPVPRAIRGQRGDGNVVRVRLEFTL